MYRLKSLLLWFIIRDKDKDIEDGKKGVFKKSLQMMYNSVLFCGKKSRD